jgi:hypothetical protein
MMVVIIFILILMELSSRRIFLRREKRRIKTGKEREFKRNCKGISERGLRWRDYLREKGEGK